MVDEPAEPVTIEVSDILIGMSALDTGTVTGPTGSTTTGEIGLTGDTVSGSSKGINNSSICAGGVVLLGNIGRLLLEDAGILSV
jgi:hypothetical protein